MPHEAVNTQHWNSLDLHNRGIDDLVDEELGNLHGQRDHGNLPLHHETSATVCTATGESHGLVNSLIMGCASAPRKGR